MKIIKYIVLLNLLTISACTSVTTLPPAKDTQTVIVHAKSQHEAVKVATHRAQRICILHNKAPKILDLDTVYQGVNSNQQALIKSARRMLPKDQTSGSYTPGGYIYKATLTFRCI